MEHTFVLSEDNQVKAVITANKNNFSDLVEQVVREDRVVEEAILINREDFEFYCNNETQLNFDASDNGELSHIDYTLTSVIHYK